MNFPRTLSNAFAPLLPLLLFASALAQSPAGGGSDSARHFARDDLTFDYPGGWTLADKSAARRSIFTQTSLCGKPVPVTGVISYNFVYQR